MTLGLSSNSARGPENAIRPISNTYARVQISSAKAVLTGFTGQDDGLEACLLPAVCCLLLLTGFAGQEGLERSRL